MAGFASGAASQVRWFSRQRAVRRGAFIGDGWIVLAAACWVAYSVLLGRWPSALPPTARLVAIIAGGLVTSHEAGLAVVVLGAGASLAEQVVAAAGGGGELTRAASGIDGVAGTSTRSARSVRASV